MEESLSDNIIDVESKLTRKIQDVESKLTHKIQDVESKLTHKIQDVESKLTHKIQDVENRLTHKIQDVENRLTNVELKIDNVEKNQLKHDKHFERIFSELAEMKEMFQKQTTDNHNKTILVEEQNARNMYVLDYYNSLAQKQEAHEERIKKLEGK